MKSIIQRNLPLNLHYSLIGKTYIPIIDSVGCVCQDCGRLISHIATVKGGDKSYNVGFDCLEKLLTNNFMVCNFDLDQLKDYRKQLNKIINFSKELNEILAQNPHVTGLYFEPQSYEGDYWYTYYLLQGNETRKGYNMSKKIKGIDYTTLHKVLANIMDVNIYFDEVELVQS